MVATVLLLQLAGGVFLLFANAFFVGTEFALTRVRQFPQREFSEGALARAWSMTDKLEIYLSGCQLGITISSVSLGVVAEPAVTAVIDVGLRSLGLGTAPAAGHLFVSVIVAVALINLLHVIVAEQAPTYLGIERTKTVCRYGAPPLYWWTKLMWPIIIGADRVAKALLGLAGVEITRSWTDGEDEDAPRTRSGLKRVMGQALSGAGVPGERKEEVMRALEIGDVPVADVMIDRDDVTSLSTNEPVERNLQRMRSAGYVRFPLVEDSLDAYRGNVYAPAVLRELDELRTGARTLEDAAAPPMRVNADEVVSDVIDRFQAQAQEMALVERDGTVIGMVTATDAVEAVVGELEDPLD